MRRKTDFNPFVSLRYYCDLGGDSCDTEEIGDLSLELLREELLFFELVGFSEILLEFIFCSSESISANTYCDLKVCTNALLIITARLDLPSTIDDSAD